MKRTDEKLAEELALELLETLADDELEATVGGYLKLPGLGVGEALA